MGGNKTKPKLELEPLNRIRYHSTFFTIVNRSSIDILTTHADRWNPKNFFIRPNLYYHEIEAKGKMGVVLKLNLKACVCMVRMHVYYKDNTVTVFSINVKPFFGGALAHVEITSRNVRFLVADHRLVYSTVACIITNSDRDNKHAKLNTERIAKKIQEHRMLQERIESYLKTVRGDPEMEIRKNFLDAHILSLEGKKNEFQGHELLRSGKYRDARIQFEYAYKDYEKMMGMIKNKKFSPGQVYTETIEQLLNGSIDLIQKAIRLTFAQYV